MLPVAMSAGARARRRGCAPRPHQSWTTARDVLDRHPALRHAREQLQAAAAGPAADLARMVTAIESDVALTAHVLRAANHGMLDDVVGVPQAVQRLGQAGVLAVALDVPEAGFFARVSQRVEPDRFRLHAVRVRAVAAMILRAREADPDETDLVLSAAMLHDLGKLIVTELHTGYAIRTDGGSPGQRFAAERRRFGAAHHAAIGAAAAAAWGLPRAIAEVIAHHHEPGTGSAAADVICLADLLAHHLGGVEIPSAEVVAAARPLGLARDQLNTLLYDLAAGGEPLARTPTPPCPLTPRERLALEALAEGLQAKQIAFRLGVSASTVRSQLQTAYRRLGVADRAQAVLVATRAGWI